MAVSSVQQGLVYDLYRTCCLGGYFHQLRGDQIPLEALEVSGLEIETGGQGFPEGNKGIDLGVELTAALDVVDVHVRKGKSAEEGQFSHIIREHPIDDSKGTASKQILIPLHKNNHRPIFTPVHELPHSLQHSSCLPILSKNNFVWILLHHVLDEDRSVIDRTIVFHNDEGIVVLLTG